MSAPAPAGPRPRGVLKAEPEHFVVEEIPLYAPSGEGDHLYVRFRKRDRNTLDVVRELARQTGADPREAGVAGMKDRRAVTEQTISLFAPKKSGVEERLAGVAIDGVTVLDVGRHGNKLKTGHLAGNRFTLRVTGLGDGDGERVAARLAEVARTGAPNAFGDQRFGTFGDNAARARAWLTGQERPPRDARLRRLHFSALQSAAFNAVLEARVADGTFASALAGDWLRKEDTGGVFLCEDEADGVARAARFEVSATGPLVGAKGRPAEGAPGELERRLAAPFFEGVDLDAARKLGEGGRRPLRVRVAELTTAPGKEPGALEVRFVLPKGAYATTVLGTAMEIAPSGIERPDGEPSLGEDD